MRYFVTVVTAACVSLFVSCGENEGGGRLESAGTASVPTLSTPTAPANIPSARPNNSPTAPIITSGRMNPSHGQPGHRCDIAVGAPLPASAAPILNTAPITAPVVNSQANATTATQPQSVASVAKGLNPPHGQPGHRCDIPVGQPLSSAPAVVSTSVNKPVAEAPDTLFAKGLNPAHGKFGHRCDIAVGQPLASIPKKDTSKTN